MGLLPPLCVHEQRAAPMTPAGFRKLFSRLAVVAKILFPVHPHMLRHACRYKLANDGRDTRAFFGVTKVPLGLTTALLESERSAQCGDALLGRVAPELARHVAHAERRQAGAAMSAEVPVNEPAAQARVLREKLHTVRFGKGAKLSKT